MECLEKEKSLRLPLIPRDVNSQASSQSKEALLIYRAQTDFLRDRRLDHEMKLEGSYYDEKGKQQREKKRGKE